MSFFILIFSLYLSATSATKERYIRKYKGKRGWQVRFLSATNLQLFRLSATPSTIQFPQ